MLSLKKISNPDAAIVKLLKFSKINTDPAIIISELEKHPNYPSLLAISDVLTALNIENSAFEASYEDLIDVPCPFIAHTNFNGGDFMVVNRIKGDHIYVSSEKWNKHKLSVTEFNRQYAGVVLVAEPSVTFSTFPVTIKSILTNIRVPAITAGLVLILLSLLFFNTGYLANLSWQTLLLTLFKSAGLLTSILLLIQSVDSNNPLVQAICQSGGKTDCNAILSSTAANVFEGLTWSEVGFFYFAGTWLLLLFGGGSSLTWTALAVLNFISLPYTFYSIYYQARVAKKWCVLCCTVQALLWLEFIPLISNFKGSSFSLTAYPAGAWSALFVCLIAPVILWSLLKPLFLKTQQLPSIKQQLHKFKYNSELFNKTLTGQPKYTLPGEEWCIVLGNAEADNIFTIATNPYCPPCAKTHQLLDELLHQNDNLQARIIFKSDLSNPVSRHLMALNQLPDKKIVKQALHDWYEHKHKTYESWAKVYPVQLDEAESYKLDKQRDWCQLADITFTPTLLLNGYRMPDLYRLPDLKYMLQ
jgi:uncharacterized membrane protein